MAGSDSEFAEYFGARAAALRRLAYTLCGDWHTADDLVQKEGHLLNAVRLRRCPC